MRLTSVLGNTQRLDGGAMFGNAPRALWERWLPPDESGLITFATRALLVQESSGRNVLFETGIGAFFEPALRERYGVDEPSHVLLSNLAAVGLAPTDIDVVVLSHLHFDHAGGLLTAWSGDATPALAFPRATIVMSADAWDRARRPHPRDRASFIAELPALIEGADRFEVVEGVAGDPRVSSRTLGTEYRFHLSNGHTPGLLMTEIQHADGPVVYVSDLIPGRPWVHVPITMGYDRYPELLIDEKAGLLDDLVTRRGRLFFTHDLDVAMARVDRDERGRYRCADEVATLREPATT